ncbi:MAG: hypothetical protein EP299_05965 [Acidobacteria bacterium]|nr:MAG: hypothetical protein EP299_05965 [Acidobacteriota bacterium]
MKILCRFLPLALGLVLLPLPVAAQAPPCRPCAGVRVDNPASLIPELAAEPRLDEEARFYIAWDVALDGSAPLDVATSVAGTGATPWLRLVFATPSPLTDNLERLESELEAVAGLAAAAGENPHFQVVWRPDSDLPDIEQIREYAFLLKRATVAVGGAAPEARVISQPLPADIELLRALYAEETAAYLDGIALRTTETEALAPVLDLLAELDPGKPIVIDALPFPAHSSDAVAAAAAFAVAGADLTFFEHDRSTIPDIGPFKLLAREFQGDLSYDVFSSPTGNAEAWSFVRGEDLGLRVIVNKSPDSETASLLFSDAQLKSPERIDPETGEPVDLFGALPGKKGLELEILDPDPVTFLRFQRLTASEREGIEGLDERLTVVSERQLPVEEILRRLQAFEDAQQRRLHTYRALNTTHLRFQFATEGLEVTFEGPIFFRQGEGFDWAWEKALFSGLKWRSKRLPKLPLIQPERAASLPLEILFTNQYFYRLRGTAIVDGRDCWVVDFRPRVADSEDNLFRGTVWIDREHFFRVRSRAVQQGLEGEVISNEETLYYSSVDAAGNLTAWDPEGFWVPMRGVSQQIWSLFNAALVVERETLLTRIAINDSEFEDRRQEVLASDTTMVRDTPAGLRYLTRDKETGERVVEEKFDPGRLFLLGGVFYDESFDFPIPLVGVDYFNLDFKETGSQVNVFFGGAILTANWSDPELFGSRFDAGTDVFLLAVAGTDTLFRDGEETPEEDVEIRPAEVDFTLGRPLGSFTKVNLTYRLGYTSFDRADDTAEEFLLPEDHFTSTIELAVKYSRLGYRFELRGEYSDRSRWEPWGLPGNTDYDSEQKDYIKWGASFAKTFHLRRFRKIGIELEYAGGADLDRFSKYEFGYFSDIRVHGYQTNKVRADEAAALHASYGFEMGEVFRLQLLGDAAWATDETAGFDREFLAGVGVAGNLVGPWRTLVRLDLGVAVAGPDDGFTAFLAFLKLFK